MLRTNSIGKCVLKHDRSLKPDAPEESDWIVIDPLGPEETQEVIDEHRVLLEAIETNPMPFGVFDASQKLVVANDAYVSLHPALAKMRAETGDKVNIYFEDIIRAQLEDALEGDALEAEIVDRVEKFKSADGTKYERAGDGNKQFSVVKYQLTSGGTADIAFDITALREREAEISSARAKAEEASAKAKRALEAERVRKQESNRLSELGEWLQSCKSLEELYRIVSRFMSHMFPQSCGELYIYSNSRDVLDGACQWNHESRLQNHIKADDCWALRRGRLLNYGTGFAELECKHVSDQGDFIEGETQYVCIPITAHGDTVGLLHFSQVPQDQTKEKVEAAWDMGLLIQCAEQISLAIANVKLRDELHDQSTRDPLTSLFNRRYFLNYCRQELSASERSNSCFSIISLDADNFKSFNDIHGHDAGDTVLCAIAKCMTQVFADLGTPARLGGEEFSIMLPNIDLEQAAKHAENLRRSIEALVVSYGGATLPTITVSCGVASSQYHGRTPQDLMQAADIALYQAKDNGRNQVATAAVSS